MVDTKIEVKAVSLEESKLFYSFDGKEEDTQIGVIGHLRGDFDTGLQFYTTFWDHSEELKTQEFKDELDIVINQLRKEGGLLYSLPSMTAYCNIHPTIRLETWNNCTYGYKIETERHCYYIRCCLIRREYNFYVYCYNRERLSRYWEVSGKN